MNPEPETSQQRPRRLILSSIVFVILVLAPASCLFQGASLYLAESKAATGEYFYVPLTQTGDRNYVKVGSFYFFSGLAGIAALAYLSFGVKRKLKIIAALVLMGALATRMVPALAWATPEYNVPIHARHAVSRAMEEAYRALLESSKSSGHLPRTEKEFQNVVQRVGASLGALSLYARGERRLPFSFVLIQKSEGPHFPEPVGPSPAVIYCALSPDTRKLWVTGTVLLRLVDDRVYFLPAELLRQGNIKGAGDLAGKAYLVGDLSAS